VKSQEDFPHMNPEKQILEKEEKGLMDQPMRILKASDIKGEY